MRRKARILILCKTYPSPSAKYAETSCVAGMDEQGALIRLFPVPFRLIGEDQQFAKWQWIEAVIEKSTQDHRPESHKIGVDTIQPKETLPAGDWLQRRRELEKLPLYESFEALEQARLRDGITLGLLRPARVTGLQIRKAGTEQWTAEELEKLELLQRQANLFDEEEVASIKRLEKVPFDFYYDYECQVGGQMVSHTHKISDWEACALYRKVRRKHGSDWEAPFREKFERVLPSQDLMFLMGNMHRFPGQWLIVSVIYPPRLQPGIGLQLPLL